MSSRPFPVSRQLLAQGGRFLLVGAGISLLYLAVTVVMRTLLGAPWALAVAIGYAVATTAHFTLQRMVVFRSERGFTLSIPQQVPRYVAIVVCQYLTTIAAMRVLPDALGLPSVVVYFGVAAVVTTASFVMLRTRLFH